MHWLDSGNKECGNYALVYSGGKEHARGVGIIIEKRFSRSMKGYLPISKRVILLKLTASPFDVNIIQVYALTTDCDEETINKFYSEVENALRHTKNSEITIIMGDLNAKVGNEAIGNLVEAYGLGNKNDRGERLIEFCQEYNFVVTNTWFKHPT